MHIFVRPSGFDILFYTHFDKYGVGCGLDLLWNAMSFQDYDVCTG
jgi:hypothetical protein